MMTTGEEYGETGANDRGMAEDGRDALRDRVDGLLALFVHEWPGGGFIVRLPYRNPGYGGGEEFEPGNWHFLGRDEAVAATIAAAEGGRSGRRPGSRPDVGRGPTSRANGPARIEAAFRMHAAAAEALYADIYSVVEEALGRGLPGDCTPLEAVKILADAHRKLMERHGEPTA